MEGFTREFVASGIVVSENTVAALEAHSAEFRLELIGTQSIKGKRDEVTVYHLRGLAEPVEVAH
jgi:class 3 adenylate cyclase